MAFCDWLSKKENLPFFESNNIKKKHIVLKLVSTESKQNYFVTNFPMAYEEPAKMYTNTDEEFFEIINTEKPDIIVVDYLPSIFFIKPTINLSICSELVIQSTPGVLPMPGKSK